MRFCLKIFVFLILLQSKLFLFSQNQLGLYGSLSHGNLVEYSDVNFFAYDRSPSFGLFFSNKISDRLNFVCQLGYERLGWISKDFDGFNPQEDLFMKGESINLFLGGKYEFVEIKRFKLGILVLPKIGYAYKQEYIHVKENKEVLSLFSINRNLLFGLDTKLNLRVSISDFVNIEVRPGFAWFSYFDNHEYLGRVLSLDFVISKSFS